MRLGAAHHALAPPVRDDGLRGFGARAVVAIERTLRKVAIKLRAIGGELRLKSIKDLFGEAAGIGRCLHHQGWHRADDGRLRYPALAVPSEIMHHLAAAGGMADVNGILQIEMRRQGRKVVRIMIHVMAVAGLAGPAVAASVMGDDPIAVTEEKQHLRVPVIGRQRPAMREHHRLSTAPILVVNLGAVFGLDGWHGRTPFCMTSFRDQRQRGPGISGFRVRCFASPGMTFDQPYVGIGRNRLMAPMITMTKNTSTMPWRMANGGSLGGTLGASACNAGTLRKAWMTSTNMLR